MDGLATGVASMRTGEKARIEIPAKLAWGAKGASGVIKPGETLSFEVEVRTAKTAA